MKRSHFLNGDWHVPFTYYSHWLGTRTSRIHTNIHVLHLQNTHSVLH
uniref:Uncharacterized protein n=1 Tax=Anguilla anguilla TaxID=7936 RepID=A0A0E9XGS3_ANGAN